MNYFLLLFSFLGTTTIFSQTNSVDVFLKNKQKISCEAIEIKPNGFLNEEKVFFYFKVIDSLHVYNNEMTNHFADLLEDERIKPYPGFTTIDLEKCIYPVILPKSGKFFTSSIVGVSVSSFYFTLAGFRLDSELASRSNTFLRLDFSTGFANESDQFFSSYNLGLAAGIKLPVFLKPQGFIGVGAFSSSDLIDGESTQYRIYFNGAIEMDIYGMDWISVTAGVNTYVVPIKYADKENTVNFSAGLNFNLSKF